MAFKANLPQLSLYEPGTGSTSSTNTKKDLPDLPKETNTSSSSNSSSNKSNTSSSSNSSSKKTENDTVELSSSKNTSAKDNLPESPKTTNNTATTKKPNLPKSTPNDEFGMVTFEPDNASTSAPNKAETKTNTTTTNKPIVPKSNDPEESRMVTFEPDNASTSTAKKTETKTTTTTTANNNTTTTKKPNLPKSTQNDEFGMVTFEPDNASTSTPKKAETKTNTTTTNKPIVPKSKDPEDFQMVTFEVDDEPTVSVTSTDSVAKTPKVPAKGDVQMTTFEEDDLDYSSSPELMAYDPSVQTQLLETMETELQQKIEDAQSQYDSKTGLGKGWDWLCGAFGGGTEGKIDDLKDFQERLEKLKDNPTKQEVEALYQEIFGCLPEYDAVYNSVETTELLSGGSLQTPDGTTVDMAYVANVINDQFQGLDEKFQSDVDSQGWISKGLGWVNNNVLGLGTTENMTEAQIRECAELAEKLTTTTDPVEFAAIYKQLTGEDLTMASLNDVVQGVAKTENSAAAEKMMDYETTQESAVNAVTTTVAGIATATMGPLGGMAVAAAINVGLNAFDAATQQNGQSVGENLLDYAKGDMLKDGLVGGVTGLSGGLANKAGSLVSGVVLKNQVGTVIASEAGEMLLQTTASRLTGELVEGALDGMVGNSLEYVVDCALDDEKEFSWSELGQTAVIGAGFGSAFGVAIGEATGAIGKGLQKAADAKPDSKLLNFGANLLGSSAVEVKAGDEITLNANFDVNKKGQIVGQVTNNTTGKSTTFTNGAKVTVGDTNIDINNGTVNIKNGKDLLSPSDASFENALDSALKTVDDRSVAYTVGKNTADVTAKTDAPKADAPKSDVPKSDAPKVDAPKSDAPKTDAPKTDAPKADVPKSDPPKVDAPKSDAPKSDAPKAEAPKAETPKLDVPKVDSMAEMDNFVLSSGKSDITSVWDENYHQLRQMKEYKVDYGTDGYMSSIGDLDAKIAPNIDDIDVFVQKPKVVTYENSGWVWRGSTSDSVDRVSLNVKGSSDLIDELDELMVNGTYKKIVDGEEVIITLDNKEKFGYKTPTSASKWGDREDPITMYFKKKASPEMLEAIETITEKYQRGRIHNAPIDSKTPWMVNEPYVTKEMCEDLIKKANAVNPNLAARVQSYVSSHKYNLSTGYFEAISKSIDDFANYKINTPNFNSPKVVTPNLDVPKTDAPKVDAPKTNVPKVEVKSDAPKVDAPNADAPNANVPKADVPKAELPKAETPKIESTSVFVSETNLELDIYKLSSNKVYMSEKDFLNTLDRNEYSIGEFWSSYNNKVEKQHSAWKMHVYSDSPVDYQNLQEVIVPYLKDNDISHKFLGKASIYQMNNSVQKGKAFTIYPSSVDEMAKVAKDLDYIIRNNNLEYPSAKISGDNNLGDTGRLHYRYEYKSGKYSDLVMGLKGDIDPEVKYKYGLDPENRYHNKAYEIYHNNLYDANRGGNNYLAADMTVDDDIWRYFDPSNRNSVPGQKAPSSTINSQADVPNVYPQIEQPNVNSVVDPNNGLIFQINGKKISNLDGKNYLEVDGSWKEVPDLSYTPEQLASMQSLSKDVDAINFDEFNKMISSYGSKSPDDISMKIEQNYRKIRGIGNHESKIDPDLQRVVSSKTPDIEVQNENGWYYRSSTRNNGVSSRNVRDRFSLNVQGDSNLIHELDRLMSSGTYVNSNGQLVSIDLNKKVYTNEINIKNRSRYYQSNVFSYKTPNDVSGRYGWTFREDPITVYVDGCATPELITALTEISAKYQRGPLYTAKNSPTPWIDIEIQRNTDEFKNLIDLVGKKHGQNYENGILKYLGKDENGNQKYYSSAGVYRAIEQMLNELDEISRVNNLMRQYNYYDNLVSQGIQNQVDVDLPKNASGLNLDEGLQYIKNKAGEVVAGLDGKLHAAKDKAGEVVAGLDTKFNQIKENALNAFDDFNRLDLTNPNLKTNAAKAVVISAAGLTAVKGLEAIVNTAINSKNTESTIPTEVQPTAPTEEQPTVPTATQPTVPTATQPTVPTEVQPTVPTATQPTVPTEVQPTVPTATQPTVPTATQPTVPTATLPTVPTEVQPTVPTATLPTVSTEVQPTVPTEVQPTVSTEVQPTVPTVTQPTVPTITFPTTPSVDDIVDDVIPGIGKIDFSKKVDYTKLLSVENLIFHTTQAYTNPIDTKLQDEILKPSVKNVSIVEQGGFVYRESATNKFESSKIGDEFMLNVTPSSKLIEALDRLMTKGEYDVNIGGSIVTLKLDDMTNFKYSIIKDASKWNETDAPITIYFEGEVNEETLTALEIITAQFERGSFEDFCLNPWMKKLSNPNEQQLISLIKILSSIDEDLFNEFLNQCSSPVGLNALQYLAIQEIISQYTEYKLALI